MRLRQLDLAAFGHFTDRTIDFGAAPKQGSDFHIVFGRNEAGKTTLMEGYLRLLFGFPAKDPYAFKHQRANLRIGGVLDIDGTEHAFTRLSKRAPNLLDAHGQAMPDTVLKNALRDLTVEEYRKLLCLDDETIEAGGEEITKSKGEIGRLLFSAAAGISDLSQVLEDVNVRSLDIYRKGGTKSEYAVLKAALADVQQKIKDQDISATAYRGLRSDLETAQVHEAELRTQKIDLALRKLQFENLLNAHPLASEWRDLDQQLRPIAHYPHSLDFDPEQVLDLMTKRVALVAKQDQAMLEMTNLAARREGLVSDPQALAMGARLDALEELKSRAQTGLLDLPRRQAELEQERADMRAQLASIGLPTSGDLGRFVLSQTDLTALEQLHGALEDARKNFDAAQREATGAQYKLGEAERLADEAAKDIGGDPALDQMIARVDADDILEKCNAAERDFAATVQRKDAALRKLTRQDRVFPMAPDLALTYPQAALLNTQLAEAQVAAKGASDTLAAAHARWTEAQTQARLTQALSDLVDDAAAAATRAARDDLWGVHKAKLDQKTAASFEAAMHADDGQTRLRAAQSKELADRRQAERRVAETQSEHAQAALRYDTAVGDVEAHNAQLAAHLRAHGLPDTLLADDFAGWVRDAQDAVTAQAEWTALMTAQTDLRREARLLQEELGPLLGHEGMSLSGLIKLAKAQMAQRATQQQALKLAETGLRAAKAETERRDKALQEVAQQGKAARQAWSDAVRQDLPELQADPQTWNGLLGLRSIRETDTLIRKITRQVETMKANICDFEAGLDAIQLPTASDTPLLERYDALRAQVSAAKDTRRQSDELEASFAQYEKSARDTARDLATLDQQVDVLGSAFGPQIVTDTLADLRLATTVAAKAIDLRAKSRKTLTSLLATLDVATWAEAEALLAQHPVTTTQVAYEATQQDLLRLDATLDSAIEARTRAQVAVGAVGADGAIAELVAQKRTIEVQLEDALMRYLDGRFGQILAEEAIRRFRDAHRSVMLAATEQAFSDLTNGAYSQLKTLPGQGGDILQALQASDMTLKEAADMSKGTRFQLYLALRAAAYEQMATNGRILPFFCDDVFETFDEDRTRAACTLMQRVGRTGQAIYLTHHQHVVDIARDVCGDQVSVHTL